jgi:ATP-dependent DNA helicase DinG
MERERLDSIERLNNDLLKPFFDATKPEAFVDEALSGDEEVKLFIDIRDELCSHLNALARELTKAAEGVESVVERDRANGLARVATRISTELKLVTRPEAGTDDGDEVRYFRWYQTRRLRSGQTLGTLVRTPLEIGKYLRDTLLVDTPRTVLVSATLAAGDNFAYLKNRLGMEDAEVPAPIEVREGSPFDYEKNCLLYVPRIVGQPHGEHNDSEDYAELLATEVRALIEAARGRTFALFTSHRMLRAVQEILSEDGCPYPLFMQGDMPNGRLVEAFVASGNGVLLGTSSFWEGVDVAGPALSCVILDKLPFATPDTPTQRAREQAIREAGGDAFRELSLPQAQLRLKQGFGRLLRTTTDRGVVAVLDNRLWTKGYGREMMASLPPCPRTYDFRDVERFFSAEAGRPPAVIMQPKEKAP